MPPAVDSKHTRSTCSNSGQEPRTARSLNNGTLKVGPAVKTIGPYAFYYTELAGLDLSDATSLVSIEAGAFSDTYEHLR